jgi:DNA-directed RNA polymerase III subunit RPC2
VYVGTPTCDEGFNEINDKVTPHETRLRDMTYSAPIYVNVEYIRGSQRIVRTQISVCLIHHLPDSETLMILDRANAHNAAFLALRPIKTYNRRGNGTRK